MYIKVRKLEGMLLKVLIYNIYSDKNKIVCESTKRWRTSGGAVRAAIKLAVALGIEYRESDHG